MKLKKLLINGLIALISSAFGLLLCEMGSRLFLDPVDYLSPALVRDPILGISLPPKVSGHDQWGFRNRKIPQSAEIVTIGDSHTYGNTAKMTESWPFVLGKITNKSVYNLGLGGYGPNQYYFLLKTKALELKPRVIICGIWMGDDFHNAVEITYGLEYWKYLRDKGFTERVNFDIWEKATDLSWFKELRNWLSKNSIIYRLVIHGLLGSLKGSIQIQNVSRLYDHTSALIIKEKNIQEAFLPKSNLKGLDQKERGVREGMRITFKLLDEMREICREHAIQFIVVVIPTKESVFSAHIEHNNKLPLSEAIDSVISNERLAREKLFGFLRESDIRYVDVLPSMQNRVDKEKLYASSAVDTHPNKNGYRVIAETIAESLKIAKGN